MIKCKDKCNKSKYYQQTIATTHEENREIEVALNYYKWEDTLIEEDLFYVDCEHLSLTLEELDILINSLSKIKKYYLENVKKIK